MKNVLHIFMLIGLLGLTSCQTRLVDQQKPLQPNTLELYHRYTVKTTDGRDQKIQVLRFDDQNIYGKNSKNEEVTIAKKDVFEIKKFNLLGSIAIGAAAVLALLFIPV